NAPSFAYRATTANNTASTSGSGISLPYWVKLVRQGTSFSGYASPDGSVWTQIGSTATISMPSTVYVGLARSSLNQSSTTPAAIDNVSVTGVADFVLTGLPLSNSSVPGGTLTYGVSLSPLGSFAGSASLSVVGLPAGASWSFSPSLISVSQSST